MDLSTATVFWSYAHADNDAAQGHVRALAKQVAGAYQIETGEALTLFVDRDVDSGLKWGDEWAAKISSTIAGTTFFIPIVSPSYLNSDNCRAEFLEFWTRAEGSDLGELLLPILYADVDLSENNDDEICQIVRKIQFQDWRETRLEEECSKVYKTALATIGRRLKAIAREVELKPDQVPHTANTRGSDGNYEDRGDDDDDDGPDEPGLFEAMALAEQAMADSEEDMAAITDAFGQIGEAFGKAPRLGDLATTEEQLAVIKTLARELDPQSDRFLSATRRFELKLREVDKALSALTDFTQMAAVAGSTDRSIQNVHGQFVEMRDKITVEVVDELPEFRQMFDMMARMSRDFKQPARKIKKGFTTLESALSLIAGWAEATDIAPLRPALD